MGRCSLISPGDERATAVEGSNAYRASIDVCVCTFHRPAVIETLRSIAAQSLAPTRIIVIDNAVEPEADELIRQIAPSLGLPVIYVHAPARNISIARNAALQAANADWIAFIDDDETAQPHWLAALIATAEDGAFDAVLGPVDAVYTADAPRWLRTIDAHSTRPVLTNGEIRKGYAGNVLIRRAAVARLGLRFDTALGRTGGEDDTFFLSLTDAGGRIGFAATAQVFEPVPAGRTKLGWLLRRSFRNGQTHGSRLIEQHSRGGARAGQLLVAAAKTVTCLGAVVAAFPSPARRGRWLLRAALHMGAVARLAGRRELEMY